MVEILEEIKEEKVEKVPSSETKREDSQDSASRTDDATDNDGWISLMGKDIQLKDLSDNDDSTKGRECQPQDAVIIDFVGRLANDRNDENGPIFQEAKDWLIVIGEKFVAPGLEMGVRFMHVGQSAVIWAHSKYVYGLSTRRNGDYELPPNSNVRYEIKVKSIYSPKEESDDPDGFQIRLALSKKLIANDVFKNEMQGTNYGAEQRAIRLYSNAADEMIQLLQSHAAQKKEQGDDYDEEAGKHKTDQAFEIMLDCLNNIAAVHMKFNRYHEAKEAAVKVLTHDPDNYKALLRAARAAMLDSSGTYEEADLAIARAEKVVEEMALDCKDVRKLRTELKQKKQQYKQRKKEMAERMKEGMKSATKTTTNSHAPTTTSKENDLQQAPEEIKDAADGEDGNKSDLGDQGTATSSNDWKSKLLPYAFQVLFPFVLYFLVTWTSRKRAAQMAPPQDLDEELQQQQGPGEF